jgi:hypothetical protein
MRFCPARTASRAKFRAVHIFRLPVREDATTETDFGAPAVGDRKHHAGEEHIDRPTVGNLHQPGFDKLVGLDPLTGQSRRQLAAPLAGPAQPEFPDGLIGEAPPPEIVQANGPLRLEQPGLKLPRRRFQHLGDRSPSHLRLFLLRAGLRHLHAGLGRQRLHRLQEPGAGRFHYKRNRIPMLAAAKAVKMVIIDIERRGLLPMKRATPLILPPRPRQPHAPPDQRRDRRPRPQLIEKIRPETPRLGTARPLSQEQPSPPRRLRPYPTPRRA